MNLNPILDQPGGFPSTRGFRDWMLKVSDMLAGVTGIDVLILDSEYPEIVVPYKEWYYEGMSPAGAVSSIQGMAGGVFDVSK